MREDPAGVVRELRNALGPKLVAYIGSVKETRAVRQWAEGERSPSSESQRRLRLALQVTYLLTRNESEAVTQSWLQGMNPRLDDRSPARVLREGDLEVDGPRVVDAARRFSEHG